MKKRKSLLYWVLTIVAIVAIIFWISPPAEERKKYDEFAQCLTDNGAVMYGTDWCHFCQDQKGKFGKKAFKEINYVNCDFNQEECNQAGVEGYPTWEVNGEIYQGVQPLEGLASLTGCELLLE